MSKLTLQVSKGMPSRTDDRLEECLARDITITSLKRYEYNFYYETTIKRYVERNKGYVKELAAHLKSSFKKLKSNTEDPSPKEIEQFRFFIKADRALLKEELVKIAAKDSDAIIVAAESYIQCNFLIISKLCKSLEEVQKTLPFSRDVMRIIGEMVGFDLIQEEDLSLESHEKWIVNEEILKEKENSRFKKIFQWVQEASPEQQEQQEQQERYWVDILLGGDVHDVVE